MRKSNEITAIPELLALPRYKGCLVSIDAMGCRQTGIASTIVKGGGDYLLAVKVTSPHRIIMQYAQPGRVDQEAAE